MAAPPRDVRMLTLAVPGPVGTLEALLRLPPAPAGAAVVAHPHPLQGGTMHTKVVHRAARLLADRFSLAALRFNFRGVGTSAGEFDDGRGETDDVVAAYEFLRSRQPAGSAVLSGFSFGSTCALRAARITQPDALLLIGLPVDLFREDEGWGLEGVKVVWVHGEEDQFGTGASAAALAERLGWTLRRIPRCDHFFTGRLDAFEDASVELLAGAGIPVTSGKEADDDEDA